MLEALSFLSKEHLSEVKKTQDFKKLGYFNAGCYTIDITPTVGIPMMGYSVLSKGPGKGYRIKLRAHAFYLEDEKGHNFIMIATDLVSSSIILHHKVANRIVNKTGVTLDRLMITGTHTHSGPGNFFGSGYYNFGGSNIPGFDEQLLDFLVDKLSTAAIQAFRLRKKAKIAFGQQEVYGYTRNRAIRPYAKNFNVDPSTLDKNKAIDPKLTLIRIDVEDDQGNFKPAGAFHNFAIHGTAVSFENDLYTADTHGVVERVMQGKVRNHYGLNYDIVYGLSQGTAGDVSPAWEVQDYKENERIGRGLAETCFELYQKLGSKLNDKVELSSFYEEVPMYNNKETDPTIKPAKRGLMGWAELGGAEDGRSFVFNFGPIAEEKPRRYLVEWYDHTYKRPFLGELQRLVPPILFPTFFALQILRINELLILTVPNEITIEMGRRIKEAALEQANSQGIKCDTAIISSITNQYGGYLTTPEEYSLQNYEGASTLYGENTGPYLTHRFKQMITQMAEGKPTNYPNHWDFCVSVRKTFFASPEKTVLGDRKAIKGPIIEQNHIWVEWIDVDKGRIDFDRPLVQIEKKEQDGSWVLYYEEGIPVSDEGISIEVRYKKQTGILARMGLYRATWYIEKKPNKGEYRFVILPRYKFSTLAFPSFTIE